jgi:stage II sporulation protein R
LSHEGINILIFGDNFRVGGYFFMKKFCITFLLSGIIILTAFLCTTGTQTATTDYLRIHIRANSNDGEDQAVKYLVRDAVVEYLTPIVANATSKDMAMALMNENLSVIERVAESVLTENGFTYGAAAALTTENFPTRVYGEYTLEAGTYQALILNLGTGSGDNWWCVIYPPLCFAAPSGVNVVYKSKIKEIIDSWKNKQ